jgi:hypothetical protein
MSCAASTRLNLAKLAPAVIVLTLAGCASIGPGTVPRDRVDYISSVAESWKEQTLLNIVRMRYGDAPTFLDVSSVISSYAIQGQLSAGGQVSSDLTNTIPRSIGTLGATGTYLDRPTITYTPVTGDKFAKSLLRPLPPGAIFELVQAGYPADAVLQITARAINGVYNRSTIGGRVRDADPNFYPVLEALRRLQLSGAVSLRLEKKEDEDLGMLVFATRRSPDAEKDLQFLEQALGLKLAKNSQLTITFGANPRNDKELAILSRSMLEIFLEVGAGIDVPAAHVAGGRTSSPGRQETATDPRDRPLIRIVSSAKQPDDSFSAVSYRGTWYWIDDDDLASKRVFTFLMVFFSLAQKGVTPQAPVLTVPAS